MISTFRTLKAHGSVSQGTQYSISIREAEVNKNDETCLFSFITPTNFHGSYSVRIEVYSGELKIERWTATYPAILNGVDGFATFEQPILKPMVILKNGVLREYSFIEVRARQVFQYEHMMFNGPTKFLIETENEIEKNATIYVGDLIKSSFSPEIKSLKPDYQYEPKPNNLKEDDLNLLRNIVLDKLKRL
jgi:hypothetical protein